MFFDDMNVVLTESNVVQKDDYRPFGLTFNSYQRVTAKDNVYKYSGKERIDDLGLGWDDFGARIYMPEIGKWNAIDPMAHKYDVVSPYNYTLNNPILFVDPDGRDKIFSGVTQKELKLLEGIINQGLQGQFKARFSNVKGKKGTLSLSLVATKGGGDISKMTDEGKAFYNHLSDGISDKENNTEVGVVFGEADIKVGDFDKSQIDIADIDQFNEGGSGIDYSKPTKVS
ncbi:RHS repeat-associated core domain-containing protein [Fulvivirga ulvae]|uniref:RHS repeat-associated core domain-containing protein n=1 Tax=Fulvivirga ulvae TaxID=2904245 RepID=UPI001F4118AD|nr:RHS repeat-associated core domain-containing protein [Fulvivirga ulvae]UII34890.1 RHS repeat-associated core domain-containing protein [Fulvivirga ulvae]